MSKEKDTIKDLVKKLQDIQRSTPKHIENMRKIADRVRQVAEQVKSQKGQ